MESFHKTVDEIEEILKKNNIWYERLLHKPVRTSEEAAEVRKEYDISQGAKALIVRIKSGGEKKFVMLVLPGDKRFDVKKAKEILDTKDIRFASEEEVEKITEGIKPGGVPPFGNLFNLPVYADKCVFNREKIIFIAGDKSISIGMYSEDYKNLVKPKVCLLT